MIRRCRQCGATVDDVYGFCIKCGWEFPKVEQNGNQCPYCGFENPDEADFCVKCGTPLLFKNQIENSETNIGPIMIKKQVISSPQPQISRRSNLLIILGYLFSILGGILGLIIAIYLSTRKDPVYRKHGHIQLAIFAFYIAIIAIMYFTGNIPADAISTYKQLLAGNLTALNG